MAKGTVMITARVFRMRPASGSGEPNPAFVRDFKECPQITNYVMIKDSAHMVQKIIWLSEKETKETAIDVHIEVSWT